LNNRPTIKDWRLPTRSAKTTTALAPANPPG
jgi:hypothetical protein